MTAVAMPSRPGALVRLVLSLAVGATVLAIAPLPEDQAEASGTTAAHPYSDPTWYPLRSSALNEVKGRENLVFDGPYSALVACVKTNCGHKASETFPNGPHGNWAVDFVGDVGDPVHAAGAGTFHIGEDSDECTGDKGRWAWVDHGGGVVSRYHHLSWLDASLDGQRVTPATKIAEMGTNCNGGVSYLHFEVRRGGVGGVRANPGQLKACKQDGSVALYPRDMPGAATEAGPFTTWDDVPHRSEVGAVPEAYNNCMPGVVATPEKVDWTRTGFGDQVVRLRWPNPSTPSNRVTISFQIYHPSTGEYSRPTYKLFAGDTRSASYAGLNNGRPYRFRVAYHNAHGNAAWGPAKVVIPGMPPDAPTKRRLSTGTNRISFGWYKPDRHGYDITGYIVGIRRATSSGWTPWTTTKKSVSAGTSHVWEGLRSRTTYQVRVRARSGAGPSDWSSKYRATTTS